jgi:hypothetical protein
MLLFRARCLIIPFTALRGEKMEPGSGLADVQTVRSRRHIFPRTANRIFQENACVLAFFVEVNECRRAIGVRHTVTTVDLVFWI